MAEILTAHADTATLLSAPAGTVRQDAESALQPAINSTLHPLDRIVFPANERPVLESFPSFSAQHNPFDPNVKDLPSAQVPEAPENGEANVANERNTAVRMRREGASFQQIADALGRSKSWAYDVAGDVPIEHTDGHAAA